MVQKAILFHWLAAYLVFIENNNLKKIVIKPSTTICPKIHLVFI